MVTTDTNSNSGEALTVRYLTHVEKNKELKATIGEQTDCQLCHRGKTQMTWQLGARHTAREATEWDTDRN